MEGKTRQERVRVRRNLGTLKSLTVQPATRKRYDVALDMFFTWLKQEGLTLPRQKAHMDHLVADYLEWLWSSGEGRSRANDTVAALQDFDPHLKHQLLQSWRLLKAWSTTEIPNRAPPLTEEAVRALAGYSQCQGNHLFGLSLLVAFYGLLRTGEVLGIKASHVTVGSPQHPALINLGFTKGGKRTGAAESATIPVKEVIQGLINWKQTAKPQDKLCMEPHLWRKCFSETVARLGWEKFSFRPYSLRRGGSTFWFRRHGSFDKLMQAGRWQALKSARIYLEDGLAMSASLNLPWQVAKPYLRAYQTSLQKPWPQLERARRKKQNFSQLQAGGTWKKGSNFLVPKKYSPGLAGL